VSLRGIGANRNLVLIDGRRSTPSNASGVTDITTIPAAAIERVEIISGGARRLTARTPSPASPTSSSRRTSRASSSTAASASPRKATGSSTSSRASWDRLPRRPRQHQPRAVDQHPRGELPARPRLVRGPLNDPLIAGTAFFNDRPGVILAGANPLCVNRTASGCTALPAGATTVSELFSAANPALTTGSGYNIQFNPTARL
jgi:hypothetical protein